MAFVRVSTKQKRDESGKKLCKVCESPLPPRRSSYCSDECWHRNTPTTMRHLVFRRDRGKCAICGQQDERWNGVWEADHVVPVSEGGGLCGLDGYQTLCRSCHGKESGELRRRLNAAKRVQKAQKETGKLF